METDFGHKMQRAFTLIDELTKGPKSIEQVASVLCCSERTAYRWIYLMDDIGFFVRRIPSEGDKTRYQIDTNRVPKFVERFIK